MTAIRIVEIDSTNRAAACALRVKPGQERFVSSVAESLADAERYGSGWPRLLVDEASGDAVGFVMGGFGDDPRFPRSSVWKLLIAGDHQGRGLGRTAVAVVAAEARRRGHEQLGVFFHPGPDGPEGFWLRIGFVDSDRFQSGPEVYSEANIADFLDPHAP